MTLTIDLERDVDYRLRREAERRGLSAEECARRLIEDALPPSGEGAAGDSGLTREERLRRLETHWRGHRRLAHPLSDKAVSRESIYEGRP